MTAKDFYRNIVTTALEKDGWTMTNEPLKLIIDNDSLHMSLGTRNILTAQKERQKIAVKIQAFVTLSPIKDLESVLKKYVLYQDLIKILYPQFTFCLAIRQEILNYIFAEIFGQILLEKKRLKLMTFNPSTEELVKWIM